MKRGIDHLVLNVRDLMAAASFYQRLGFTTTPRAAHPFGTANRLVQLQGNFIELVTVAEPAKITAPPAGHFGFAAFCRGYLEKREGMSMLVFHSADARADQAEFVRNGLQTYAPLDFERQAVLPNGSRATVAFSLAFVTHAQMPEAAFFCCQQHAPQYFWKPEYQTHANGAHHVSKVFMVAEEPPGLRDFFACLHDADNVDHDPETLTVTTSLGDIVVTTPRLFEQRFEGLTSPHPPQTPHFAAYQISVEDLGRVKRILEAGEIGFTASQTGVRIGAGDAFGMVIEFVPR